MTAGVMWAQLKRIAQSHVHWRNMVPSGIQWLGSSKSHGVCQKTVMISWNVRIYRLSAENVVIRVENEKIACAVIESVQGFEISGDNSSIDASERWCPVSKDTSISMFWLQLQ